ncbi:MAG: pilus assembly protein [Proteobacteria bacterium]|nr:pilus assembly protein [Pseudomonadota bacterium]
MRSVAGFFRGLMGAVSGTAAVEFALFLFFILMPFLFGIFEIGRALQQHHVVTKSVRDAARYVARRELETGTTEFDAGCAKKGSYGGGSSPAGDAKDLAMYGKFRPATTGATPLMAAWDAAANPAAYQTVCITGPKAVDTGTLTVDVVTVTASVPFEDILLQAFGIGPITFDVSHQERYIGE